MAVVAVGAPQAGAAASAPHKIAPPPKGSAYTTILGDGTNYHVKHPLQSHWTLHQKIGSVKNASSRAVSQSDWEEKLKESVTIGTVEDFWCLYNEMQAIETIPTDCDYFFMREGVKPMWEDPANIGGGELRATVNRAMNGGAMWMRALLLAVGSQLTDFALLNGIQFAFRSAKNRISIWIAAAPSEAIDRIRAQFFAAMEEVCGEPTALRIDFQSFTKIDRPSRPSSGGRGGSHHSSGTSGDQQRRDSHGRPIIGGVPRQSLRGGGDRH